MAPPIAHKTPRVVTLHPKLHEKLTQVVSKNIRSRPLRATCPRSVAAGVFRAASQIETPANKRKVGAHKCVTQRMKKKRGLVVAKF